MGNNIKYDLLDETNFVLFLRKLNIYFFDDLFIKYNNITFDSLLFRLTHGRPEWRFLLRVDSGEDFGYSSPSLVPPRVAM